MRAQKKDKRIFKKDKKGQNIWKFRQKCTTFEKILKKDRWLHKLLEKALLHLSLILTLWFFEDQSREAGT